MRLTEVRDAITALNIAQPWGFTGAEFVETLGRVDTMWGPVAPPFALDLELSDPFLLVEHVGHVPESSIEGFRSLQDLEFAILSGAGFMNNFVTHCVAFAAGKASLFKILFRDESGAEIEFDKHQQLEEDDYGREYPGRRLEWLELGSM
jgi:hypothetical protein